MINVVIVSEFFGGGVEKVNTILARELNRSKFNVTFVSLVTDPKSINNSWGFDYICLNVSSKKKSYKKLINTLKKLQPDIILTSCLMETYFSYIYKQKYNKPASIIYVQHSVMSMNMNSAKAIIMNRYLTKVTGIFNKLDAIVFVSEGVTEDFLLEVNQLRTKTRIIYNPITDDSINYVFRSISINDISIVSAGRIETEKCHEDIIDAVYILTEKGYKVQLTILGEGSQQACLEKRASELGISENVIFMGYVPNVQEVMRNSDIFVLSSIYESFGNVIVEAMNIGLPIISTDCPVGPAEILNHGEYGMLVPIHDSNAIADAILKTIETHSQTKIKSAYERSLNFSIQSSIKGYEKLFIELVEAK